MPYWFAFSDVGAGRGALLDHIQERHLHDPFIPVGQDDEAWRLRVGDRR